MTKITNKGSDNSFSGEGIVSCTLLKNKLGLNVTFDNIKINSDHYLCKGKVLVVHDITKDNLLINLNDWTGKNQGAKESPQQENLGDEVKNLEEAKKHPNETVIYNGKLYAVDENGNPQEVGEVKKKEDLCDKPTSGLDLEDGGVVFDVEPGLNQGKYDPYIDKYASPFADDNITEGYKPPCLGYSVPWISMVEGEERYIVARKGGKAKDAESSTKMDNIDFYCYAADGSAVKLEKEPYKDGMVKVKIYGGLKNTALEIYARENAEKVNGECNGNEKTYGVVKIYTMSHQTKKILLAPVLNEMTLNIEQMQNEVNKKFAPLGKKFEFVVGEAYTKEKDPKLASLLENGLNTNENENHFTMETKEMKYIRKNYVNYISNTADFDACLFLVPEAAKPGLQGYMPLLGSVGYIFVGKQPSLDANTITHELCHGLFCIQHVFDYNGVAEGSLPENIMDYPKSDSKITDRYLTKYFQWKDVENERHIHLSFLDDPEDSESKLPKNTLKKGIEIAAEKIKEKQKTGDWSFTEENLSDLLDAASKDSPEAGKALIKTYRELANALECGTSGQSVEYCLCNQGSDLLEEALELLTKKLDKNIDNECSKEIAVIVGPLCDSIKKHIDETPGKTKEQLKTEFCDKYAPRRETSYIYADIIDKTENDDEKCVKYKVVAGSGKKLTLDHMEFNGITTLNSLNLITVDSKNFNYEDYEVFEDQLKSVNVNKNSAVRIKAGNEVWAWHKWYWKEVVKSMDDPDYYGEWKVYEYTEILLVNLCCSDEMMNPYVDLVFNFSDDKVKNKSKRIQNFLCKSDALKKFDCVFELTDAQRNQYNLPRTATLKKGNGIWYVAIDGEINKQYIVTVTDEKNCKYTIEECKIPFDVNVKSKFNLPSNARLVTKNGKYYVTFESSCCYFEFRALVKDCELVNVYLDVPDFTITKDGLVYYKNKLKKASEIGATNWPEYYIDCEHIYVKGEEQEYVDYFTLERIQHYFIDIYLRWIYYPGPDGFKKYLDCFCENYTSRRVHNWTFTSEWEQVIKGQWYNCNKPISAMECLSTTTIDWEKLRNDVIEDMKALSKDCRTKSMDCLLAKLISSMSKHMMEDYMSSDGFIIDGKIPYNPYDISSQNSLDLKGYTVDFDNSLTETIIRLYVIAHGNDSRSTFMNSENHLRCFRYYDETYNGAQPMYFSIPYMLINIGCGCK